MLKTNLLSAIKLFVASCFVASISFPFFSLPLLPFLSFCATPPFPLKKRKPTKKHYKKPTRKTMKNMMKVFLFSSYFFFPCPSLALGAKWEGSFFYIICSLLSFSPSSLSLSLSTVKTPKRKTRRPPVSRPKKEDVFHFESLYVCNGGILVNGLWSTYEIIGDSGYEPECPRHPLIGRSSR